MDKREEITMAMGEKNNNCSPERERERERGLPEIER